MPVSYELELRIETAIRTPEQAVELIEILNSVPEALTPAANVPELNMTADVAYDDAQLQAVADKVDAIIAALVAAGLMEA